VSIFDEQVVVYFVMIQNEMKIMKIIKIIKINFNIFYTQNCY
jgi:hypothetical protein